MTCFGLNFLNGLHWYVTHFAPNIAARIGGLDDEDEAATRVVGAG